MLNHVEEDERFSSHHRSLPRHQALLYAPPADILFVQVKPVCCACAELNSQQKQYYLMRESGVVDGGVGASINTSNTALSTESNQPFTRDTDLLLQTGRCNLLKCVGVKHTLTYYIIS